MHAPERPLNILFLLPDQHRPDWLGCHGTVPVRTPTLDALAASGIRFTNAFCNSPLCAPSRAALASGRSYHRCGVVNNGQDYPLTQPTYYQALREGGYRVAGVGKFDLHKPNLDWNLDGSRLIRDWGFTEGIDNEGKLDGSTSYRRNGKPMGPYLAFLDSLGLAGEYAAEHDPVRLRACGGAYTTGLPDHAYCDNWLSENGLRFLNAFPKDTPWHLVVNFTGPHDPMEVTASMRARWEKADMPPPCGVPLPVHPDVTRARQNYAAAIENIDRQAGRFIDAVRARGELDRTLIVYSSDHGEMLGDHGKWGKNTWRTPSSGIPLIVAGPGLPPGRISDALVSLHDLAATFLDFAGQSPLPGADAMSLRPLLEGQTTAHRPTVTCGLNAWRMIFDGRYKFVTGGADGDQLFDLQADPHETRNALAALPEPARALHQLLKEEQESRT